MPAVRLTMRKIREVLRLKYDNQLSNRQIAKSCLMARSTVGDYLRRFNDSGLSWPLDPQIDDQALEQLLFVQPRPDPGQKRPVPEWLEIQRQLRRKGVSLMLLWQEYKAQHPSGYQYSQFCQRYRNWRQKLDPVMRQHHRAGEKLFVDYAGMSVAVNDPKSDQVRQAQIFVAVMGASNYCYAEATWTQSLPDWIGSHTRAFAYFGGVPRVVVPDNLKSAVKKASFYEPDINPTYLDLARHYETVIIPTRVRKPKDKAKVEAGVQLVERWVLARIRDQKFFSLHHLNRTIGELLEKLNQRAFQKLPGSRKSMFESIDRPALKPLPQEPYQFAEWKKATVNVDYHIEFERHYYSVPHRLIKKKIDLRITQRTIECFYNNKRVASHIRSHQRGRHTTVREHMPKTHQKWADWTPQRFIRWAEKIGPHTADLIRAILSSRLHPQQGFRSSLGILRLAKDYGDQRLEAACHRALAIGGTSYKSVASILKHNLDQRALPDQSAEDPSISHKNIRGARYYN